MNEFQQARVEMKLVKLSGQRGQGHVKSTGKTDLGLFEIKLQLLKATRNLTSWELYYKGILQKDTYYYNNALRPNILVVWGALCG